MSAAQRGLNLIEVAIVVALIAVLMAVSLPMLSRANGEARAAVCRQNLADIGIAITAHIHDHGKLPELAELPPHQPGMSLPELVTPRLKTPNVLFCPSDETDKSQSLGTSYRWTEAHNGIEAAHFEQLVDQPVLADREAFHQGIVLGINQLVLKRNQDRVQFVILGGAEHESVITTPER